MRFGVKPSAFSTLVFENPDAWKSDVDVYINSKNIALLHKNMGIEKKRIINSTLYATCHYFYNQTEETPQVKWVMPIGVRTKNKNYGLQYCPCCLIEDENTPYFRKNWRLGFLTCCLNHAVQLHDRCPKCYQPINIKKLQKSDEEILYHQMDIVQCSKCRFDLRETKYVHTTKDEYEINRINHVQAMLGYGKVGNMEFCYSNLYFEGMRRLMSFLACSPKGEKLFIHLRTKLELYQPYHREIIGHNIEPERLNIELRRAGLLMVHYLLKNWPDSFIEACRSKKLTSHLVQTPYLEFPFWVSDALFFHIHENKFFACEEEKKSIIKFFEKRLKKTISQEQVARFVKYYF